MIDSHTHISSEKYPDLEQILKRAKEKGIKKIITISLNKIDFEFYKNLQNQKDNIYIAYGVHPADINNPNLNPEQFLQNIETAIKKEEIVAIGEIGLDHHWIKDIEDQKKQKELFIKQIQLAKKYDLPIIVHSRDAIDETYEIIEQYQPVKGVIHSFSGNTEQAKKFINLGLKIGISGIVTFKNNNITKNVVREINLENILIETDCPYLAPEPYRGQTNEPSYVREVALKIAELKSIPLDEVDKSTTNNTSQLFNI